MRKVLLMLACMLIMVSCASIVKGNKQLITVNCNVEGAEVMLDGVLVGETPFVGEVPRNKKIMTVQKQGYKPYTLSMSTQLEGMFWGNIITGGTLGSITDFASGAAWAYSPSSFQVELMEEGMSLQEFEKNINLKKFAMINMSNIAIDLSNNEGPYLASLLNLAGMDSSMDNVELVKDNFNRSHGDQVAFGQLMVNSLQN